MNRLFICGITCGPEIDKIKDLVNKTKDHVDGFIWTVDNKPLLDFMRAKDGQSDKPGQQCWDLIQFLETNKKEGEVVQYSWKNAHDWSANEWLHCGTLKEGDWVWMFDSSESPTDEWLKTIKENIKDLESNGFGAVYCSGRPYLFKYSDYLFFHGTPHWGLYGHDYKRINSIPEEKKSNFIVNKRDLSPAKHYQEHDTKYYLYGRSNVIDGFYGKYGQNIVNYHEHLRRAFKKELANLGYKNTLPQLEAYFKNGVFSDFAKEVIEMEFSLSEYYRRTVLNEDFIKDIVPRRELWSFKNFLETGNGFSDPDYLGTRPKYDLMTKKA